MDLGVFLLRNDEFEWIFIWRFRLSYKVDCDFRIMRRFGDIFISNFYHI